MKGAEGMQSLGLKAFRAGRATAMIKKGCSLARVLIDGEWRASCWMRYVDVQQLDEAVVFNRALLEDEEEEE